MKDTLRKWKLYTSEKTWRYKRFLR